MSNYGYRLGACLRVTGSGIDDVLLVIKPTHPQPAYRRVGLLLCTGKVVTLVLVKNYSGDKHLSCPERLYHLDTLEPMTKRQVEKFYTDLRQVLKQHAAKRLLKKVRGSRRKFYRRKRWLKS
ncbi:MAG: hypothetical protein Q7S50_03805 [bacterium]|nr:hypothetical protein [bacterium]